MSTETRAIVVTSVFATALATSCADENRSVGLFDEGTDSNSGGVSATGSSADSADASSGAGSDDGEGSASDTSGLKLDVGAPDTDGLPCPDGNCESCSAVDLLFVIDNSVSMSDYQVALGQAFPTFAEAIVDALPPGTSLHVGVTSTTMGHSNSGSTMNCTATGDNMQPAAAFYTTPDVMDTGTNGAQGRLYTALGQPYFDIGTDATPDEIAELEAWFTEAAQIGESGSQVEMSAAGAGWATDPANDATNTGFIRDEGAVLVIFFIQDEPDQTPPEEAQDLVDRIAAAKQGCGGMQCVVGGGFVDQNCLPQVALGTLFDAFGADPVISTLPPENSVSPQTFEPVLEDTLAQVIAQKCDEIPPAG